MSKSRNAMKHIPLAMAAMAEKREIDLNQITQYSSAVE
jgi:hypothetical protein